MQADLSVGVEEHDRVLAGQFGEELEARGGALLDRLELAQAFELDGVRGIAADRQADDVTRAHTYPRGARAGARVDRLLDHWGRGRAVSEWVAGWGWTWPRAASRWDAERVRWRAR